MIIVTGGAGFIGSNLINFLEDVNTQEVVSVDWKNHENAHYFNKGNLIKVSPNNLKKFLNENKKSIKLIIHLGAITSTTETNAKLIIKNNISLSLFIWSWCVENKKRLIYASSAATYGDGSNNFDDQEKNNYLSKLVPLNLYGWSKHLFDKFVISQKKKPPQYVGLKFFNVYGPNEFHKSEMRSIVLKIFQKVSGNQTVKLFKSHHPNYKDGEQMRDFIYVKDVINIICDILDQKRPNEFSYKTLIKSVDDRLGHDFRYSIDSSKLQDDLGWKPKYNFKTGIQLTIDWYLENIKWIIQDYLQFIFTLIFSIHKNL